MILPPDRPYIHIHSEGKYRAIPMSKHEFLVNIAGLWLPEYEGVPDAFGYMYYTIFTPGKRSWADAAWFIEHFRPMTGAEALMLAF